LHQLCLVILNLNSWECCFYFVGSQAGNGQKQIEIYGRGEGWRGGTSGPNEDFNLCCMIHKIEFRLCKMIESINSSWWPMGKCWELFTGMKSMDVASLERVLFRRAVLQHRVLNSTRWAVQVVGHIHLVDQVGPRRTHPGCLQGVRLSGKFSYGRVFKPQIVDEVV